MENINASQLNKHSINGYLDNMDYIKDIIFGIWNLIQGMYITILNFFRKKITEQYPENRSKVFPHKRMRGQLIMPHNEKNEHKCTACGICEMNCPNKTIQVISKKEKNKLTGKEKKIVDKYLYDIGSCIFCDLCTITCSQKAIKWSNHFEHSVFTRSKLKKKLNKENSILRKKNELD